MEKGTYALVMALKSEAIIAVGKLGRFKFPAGYYVYFGSARGGLSARVGRHLRSEGGKRAGESTKKLHWHIDYLIQFAEVVEVWYAVGNESWECLWCEVARGMPNAQILIPGFGSSDCRCPSHLIYFSSPPSFELFQKCLGDKVQQLKRATPLNFLSGL